MSYIFNVETNRLSDKFTTIHCLALLDIDTGQDHHVGIRFPTENSL
jgi:hypothetical protein